MKIKHRRLGLILLVVLFCVHALRIERPLLDIRLYANRVFAAASLTTFALGASLFGAMILVPLYYQEVRHESVIITGLLVGVYAGLVLLATEVLGFASTWAVAGSTLAAAALFTPLRRRVQRVVDRRFNRARYDADAAVTAFAGRLQDAVDLEAVRADLLTSVAAALEPAHLSAWLQQDPR